MAHKIIISSALVFISFFLSACESFTSTPNFMPQGYRYHSEEYKSPRGKAAPDIGYRYTAEDNAAVLGQWDHVARQMITALEVEFGMEPQMIFIAPAKGKNAFNSAFEYALRNEFMARGYDLAARGRNSMLEILPEAWLPEDENFPVDANRYKDDPALDVTPENPSAPRNFMIALSVLRNDVVIGKMEQGFSMPAYGYDRRDGMDRVINTTGHKPARSTYAR